MGQLKLTSQGLYHPLYPMNAAGKVAAPDMLLAKLALQPESPSSKNK